MDKLYYQKAYQATIKNSKILFSSSKILASKRHYGVATSLCILSAEEGIKALVLLIKVSGYKIEIPDFEKVFISHAVKHNYIKSALGWRDGLLKLINGVNEEFKSGINKRIKEKDKTFVRISKSFKKVQKQLKTPINASEMEKWLVNANNVKNNGLYVNLKSPAILKPLDIKSKDYLLSTKYTMSIIELVEIANEVVKFNQKFKN